MKTITVNVLSNKAIDVIRDIAIDVEKNDLNVARELMHLAHLMRPSGYAIKTKLNTYDSELCLTDAEKKLRFLVQTGVIAIIPIGFRCNTKNLIRKRLKISQ